MPTIIGVTGRKRSGKDTVAEFIDDIVMGEFGTSDEFRPLMSYGDSPAHPRCVYRIAFAQPLKEMCMSLFGWSEEHVNGRLKEEPDRRYPRYENVKAWEDFRSELGKLIDFWVTRNQDRSDMKRDIRQLMTAYSSVLQPSGPPVLTPRFAMQHLGTEFGRWMSPNLWVDLALRKAQQAQPEDIVIITDVRFLNEAQAVKDAGGVIWRVLREAVEPKSRADRHASEEEMMEIIPDLILENNDTLELLRETVKTSLSDLLGGIVPVYAEEEVDLEDLLGPPKEKF